MHKQCKQCSEICAPSSFHKSQAICKLCHRKRCKKWRQDNQEYKNAYDKQRLARIRAEQALSKEYDDVMSEHEGEATSLLYLMGYQFDPCRTFGIKIGRTDNLAARVEQNERCHNFRMKVLRVYRGLGDLEPLVHELLASKRMTQGAGTEWFDVSFATAMKAVALARAIGPGDDVRELASAFSESDSCSST